MRTLPSLVLALLCFCAAVATLGAHGCSSNSGSSKAGQAFFGPGSAPNSNSQSGNLGGGFGGSGPGTFSAGPALVGGPRAGHTANVLNSGKVLVVGGVANVANTAFHPDAEIYDPTANTWVTVASLHAAPATGRLMDATGAFATGRHHHTATTLNTGSVMIMGGLGFERLVNNQPVLEALKSTYVFEETTNTFNRQAPSPVARYFHLAHLTAQNKVITAFGFDKFGQPATASTRSADLFDPGAGTWTSVGGQANGIVFTGGHTWGNVVQFKGDVLFTYGVVIDNAGQTPFAGIWGVQPANPPLSGLTGTSSFGSGGEVFNGQNGVGPGPTFQREPAGSGIVFGAGITLSTGDVFFAGGENLTANKATKNTGATAKTEVLEAATSTPIAGPDLGTSPVNGVPGQPLPRTECLALEIGATASILIFGGSDATGAPSNEAEVYDSVNKLMVGRTTLLDARTNFAAARIKNGVEFVIIGGRGVDAMGQPELKATVELWKR